MRTTHARRGAGRPPRGILSRDASGHRRMCGVGPRCVRDVLAPTKDGATATSYRAITEVMASGGKPSGMRPRAGLGIRGPVFSGATERAVLGRPTWGPRALLDDLELRLGLRSTEEAESARVPRWAARIKSLGDAQAFYARSFSVDELGTTAVLLEWRDNLVEAGWNGSEIGGGAERLGGLARSRALVPCRRPLEDRTDVRGSQGRARA